nr:hypothetical protein [Elioraea rosea]
MDRKSSVCRQFRANEGGIQPRLRQALHRLPAQALLQDDRDAGQGVPERPDDPRHERVERCRVCHADAQLALLAAGDASRLALGLFEALEDRARFLEQEPRALGQLHPARLAAKQLEPEIRLHRLDLLAERRLPRAKPLDSARPRSSAVSAWPCASRTMWVPVATMRRGWSFGRLRTAERSCSARR